MTLCGPHVPKCPQRPEEAFQDPLEPESEEVVNSNAGYRKQTQGSAREASTAKGRAVPPAPSSGFSE